MFGPGRILLWTGALVWIPASLVSAAIVNTEIKRKVDITTHVAKIITTYTASGVDGEYEFGLPLGDLERLAHLRVTSTGLVVNPERRQDQGGFAMYSVRPNVKDGSAKIRVTAVYTDVLQPYPREITMLEPQLVLYNTTLLAPTPYPTDKQTTAVHLQSTQIQSYSQEHPPVSVKGDVVTFGPYLQAGPLNANDVITVHAVNHAPFAKVTTCLREIEVSNWGNIAVEELYEMEHSGARLTGGFSRVDYNERKYMFTQNPSFRFLKATLPRDARDIYYRDNIGNVSTSELKPHENGLDMIIGARYPLFGGWKTAWYQGYNIPAEVGLRHSGSQYTLEMDFGVPFTSPLWVEDLTVKVILPEGATNVGASVPFEVEEKRTRRFTYLDTPLLGGRPVVILRKTNVVADHNVKFQVTYTFNKALMLQEPLLLVGGFLACFLVFMALFRLDQRSKSSKLKTA